MASSNVIQGDGRLVLNFILWTNKKKSGNKTLNQNCW